jgi:hypothetical protein
LVKIDVKIEISNQSIKVKIARALALFYRIQFKMCRKRKEVGVVRIL